MKKLLCLVLAMLIIGCGALCESIDISGLSDAELLELKQQVDNALFERLFSAGRLFPAGKYIVGVDIKPGKYVIHTSSTDNGGNGHIYIFADAEGYASNDSIYSEYFDKRIGTHLYISLEEGNVFVFDYEGTATIEKSSMIE